ncbi:hypothetical protein CSUI_009325, partial [Cystoisospora suis]
MYMSSSLFREKCVFFLLSIHPSIRTLHTIMKLPAYLQIYLPQERKHLFFKL